MPPTRASYYKSLEAQNELPRGFTGATRSFTFSSAERGTSDSLRMDLSLIAVERPSSSVAAVTTTNRFPGAPVLMVRELLSSGGPVKGVLLNNKVANVGVPGGLEDAKRLTGALSDVSGEGSWISLSTGVIGWRLPMAGMLGELTELYEARRQAAGVDLAEAIMTTDRYPKLKKVTVGHGSILGVAKGAGMIEPNLATMLSVILTDCELSRESLSRLLKGSVDKSFNRIGVDGEQSTSDVVLLISSGLAGPVDPREFGASLDEVTGYLARHVVRNGEGTGHVVRVEVRGLPDRAHSLYLARRVSNSPLVKSAIYGNDPNVGRILMALGDGLSDLDAEARLEELSIEIDGTRVFREGHFDLSPAKEQALSQSLRESAMDPALKGYPQHDREVTITVDFGDGSPGEVVYGSDLSYEYVRENADYRT
jgi:glutamate N-acetyltransferase/amino-acid N-acetyltransferase